MAGVFLSASVLDKQELDSAERFNVEHDCIEFYFPEGFAELRLIEECRALNCLDVSDPDNFDFMYDITMQMLTGKTVFIYFIDETGEKKEIEHFLVTNRYMDLRGVALISEYPVLVNWLVNWIAGYLGKKFPRSLKDIQAKMSERGELMKKSLKKEEVQVKASFLTK